MTDRESAAPGGERESPGREPVAPAADTPTPGPTPEPDSVVDGLWAAYWERFRRQQVDDPVEDRSRR